MGEFLRIYASNEVEWDEFVEFAAFCHNTTVHLSTGLTPYETVFGKEAQLPNVRPSENDMTYGKYVADLMTRLSNLQNYACEHLLQSKFRNKYYYDRKLNPNELKIGDYVFMDCSPIRGKMDDCYKGPYKVLDLINDHNVKIQLNKGTKIVHRDKLRLSYVSSANIIFICCRS